MNEKQGKEKLVVFDTTLRDGEQSPGAAMSAEQKVAVARQLERLGVDIIEAGFPASGMGDLEAVKAVSAAVSQCTVCALARANDRDVDHAADAVAGAARPRIHTFIATSPLHMREKLGLEPDEVVERAAAAVKRARGKVDDVEFSMEDAGRSEIDFLCKIVERAIDEGAGTINVPDTVGYTVPEEFADLVRQLIDRVPNSDKAVFSVHCHDDLGLAVANTLAAVNAGARQVECTVNGIGERAGNASLEEIVMAIKTREEKFAVHTDINTREIVPTSALVSKVTDMAVQPNKAIVGDNAFAHESGIHQDGVLKNRRTYEIMGAEDVGWDSNRIPLGKLSGRSAVRARIKRLDSECFRSFFTDKEGFERFFRSFKEFACQKRKVTDKDLVKIASEDS